VGFMGVTETLVASAPMWATLEGLLEKGSGPSIASLLSGSRGGSKAEGLAGNHAHEAREEAARKLISNHELVLKDLVNHTTQRDVTGTVPLTQLELKRIAPELAPYVDQALRETARRLLGQRPGAHDGLEVKGDPENDAQMGAWRDTAVYLDGRIQSTAEEKPGRAPDVSAAAANAMRDVLKEVGGFCEPPKRKSETNPSLLAGLFRQRSFVRRASFAAKGSEMGLPGLPATPSPKPSGMLARRSSFSKLRAPPSPTTGPTAAQPPSPPRSDGGLGG